MAYIGFLLSIIVCFATTKEADVKRAGKYEDLIYQSMKSIVTLDELVTTLSVQVASLTTSLSSMQVKVEQIEKQLRTSIANIDAKVERVNKEVVVVSGEASNGHEKCVKVCAGTTGRDTTNWVDYSSRGVYSDVDMTSCGFVKVPTVTTSIEGTSSHWVLTGTSSVYHVQPSKFRIYLYDTHSDPRGGVAKKRGWNVEWIAVGFTC